MTRILMTMMIVTMVAGCSSSTFKRITRTDQCMAPTDREAKITKRAWTN